MSTNVRGMFIARTSPVDAQPVAGDGHGDRGANWTQRSNIYCEPKLTAGKWQAMAKEEQAFRIGFLVHDVSRLRRTVVDQELRPCRSARGGRLLAETQSIALGVNMRIMAGINKTDIGKSERVLHKMK